MHVKVNNAYMTIGKCMQKRALYPTRVFLNRYKAKNVAFIIIMHARVFIIYLQVKRYNNKIINWK